MLKDGKYDDHLFIAIDVRIFIGKDDLINIVIFNEPVDRYFHFKNSATIIPRYVPIALPTDPTRIPGS